MLACNYDTDCHMVINTNTAAARGARYLGESSGNLQKSLARLSSGSKIVEPQDDAAGMAVASRMDAQIHRTEATRSNIGNAISYKQTQDGYLAKAAKALDRMSELATLAQDGTKTTTDLALYNKEYSTLYSYLDVVDSQTFAISHHDVAIDEHMTHICPSYASCNSRMRVKVWRQRWRVGIKNNDVSALADFERTDHMI